MIEDYKQVLNLSSELIILTDYKIYGQDLKIILMDGYELWLKGIITKMEMAKNEIQTKNR